MNKWWMNDEWMMNEWWMNDEWMMNEWWMNDEWMMNEWWMNDEWMMNEWWMNGEWMMNEWWTNDEWMMNEWWMNDEWMMNEWWMNDEWMVNEWWMNDEWMMNGWWMNDEWVPMCRVERLKGAWGTHSWACLSMSGSGHGVKAFPARHVVRSAQTPKATHSIIAQGCTAAHFVLPKFSAIMSLDSGEASTHTHTHTHTLSCFDLHRPNRDMSLEPSLRVAACGSYHRYHRYHHYHRYHYSGLLKRCKCYLHSLCCFDSRWLAVLDAVSYAVSYAISQRHWSYDGIGVGVIWSAWSCWGHMKQWMTSGTNGPSFAC